MNSCSGCAVPLVSVGVAAVQKLLDDHEALDNYIKFDGGYLRSSTV